MGKQSQTFAVNWIELLEEAFVVFKNKPLWMFGATIINIGALKDLYYPKH